EDRTIAKKIKKVKFLDEKSFFKVLDGENLEKNVDFFKKEFYTTKEDLKIKYEKITELRTMVYRVPKIEKENNKLNIKTNELFEKDIFVFDKDFSFYFLIKVPEEIKEKIKIALKSIEGIGGKRSSGYGEVEMKEITNNYKNFIKRLKERTNENEGFLLNSVLANEDIEGIQYNIIEFGGYFDLTNNNPLVPKPQLFYFEEGSNIKVISKIKNKEEKFKGLPLFIYKNPWVVK
ncbi:MAG: RAMP superfamily CRISPR-associated protein, partial [Nanoarchaeota archaeon]